MRKLIPGLFLMLGAACVTTDGEVPGEPLNLAVGALDAEGLDGEVIDLNQDIEAGRPIALVFWQAW